MTGAVLVYEGGSDAFAAWHPVKTKSEGGLAYLAEAEPLTTEFLRSLSAGLGAYVPPEILPANMLVRTSELMVWWTPAQHRTLFFSEQSEAGKELSGRRYPIPGLIFKVSGGRLWLRALDRNERPGGKTKLRTAPFWNGNDAGEICLGTMRVPQTSGAETIDGWERGFFESEFTHAYGAARLTSHPGGFLALCRQLKGSRKPFPAEYLTDARETLQQFVERR
ncbi:MAG: PRTRC system protein B [Bryobacteraceae bacterium]|nr:PRTRC system protein B [Bryobacteraceae bacterium]